MDIVEQLAADGYKVRLGNRGLKLPDGMPPAMQKECRRRSSEICAVLLKRNNTPLIDAIDELRRQACAREQPDPQPIQDLSKAILGDSYTELQAEEAADAKRAREADQIEALDRICEPKAKTLTLIEGSDNEPAAEWHFSHCPACEALGINSITTFSRFWDALAGERGWAVLRPASSLFPAPVIFRRHAQIEIPEEYAELVSYTVEELHRIGRVTQAELLELHKVKTAFRKAYARVEEPTDGPFADPKPQSRSTTS